MVLTREAQQLNFFFK